MQQDQTIKPAIKHLNRVFISATVLGTIAGVTDIVLTNIDIQPISTKAWLACGFLSACLVSVFILGLCTTTEQYVRLGYPFQDTKFELKRNIWMLWFICGALINLVLIASAVTLIVELTTHHLASLPAHHSILLGKAALGLAVSCLLYAIFTAFTLVIWYRNFGNLMKMMVKGKGHSSQSTLITMAARGSGSLCELLLGWICFAGGFLFTSLKLSSTTNLHSHLLDQFIPIALFTTAILFLLMSFIGGHPLNDYLRDQVHRKFSCISKGFKCYLTKVNKKLARERGLSGVIEASAPVTPTTTMPSNPNILGGPHITQSSQLSDQTTEQKDVPEIIESQLENKTSSTKISTGTMGTPATEDDFDNIAKLNEDTVTPTTELQIQDQVTTMTFS